ncbi:MAG: biotin--[Lachnospiraceae bacterium]|nr:biotin--[acetyl-CoA-carboxylase] ligase [Lachnospiraceae bacterium]
MKDHSLIKITCYCVDSTNTALKAMAGDYPDKDVLLVAKTQTGGRGRMGRSFSSPEGGIYMSLLLHPDIPASESLFLTTAMAVAVSKAVEGVCGRETSIKWVNDVFMDGKKICGILTEAKINSESLKPDYTVVGVGINVEEPENGFESELKDIAGAIYPYGNAPSGIKDALMTEVIKIFYMYYEQMAEKAYFEEYKKRSCLIGKEVRVVDNVLNPGQTENAVVLDINEKCHLIVKYQDGTVKALSSGDVSIRQ